MLYMKNAGILLFLLVSNSICALGQSERRQQPPAEPSVTVSNAISHVMFAGTNEGLFTINSAGRTESLWTGGSVKKILNTTDTWVILSNEGILISKDMQNWEKRNQGLPVKTIKIYNEGKKTFLNMVQEVKDIEINPVNPQIMVCNTKDRVFLSRNQGQSWTALASLPYQTNGIKAVASAYMPQLTVFLSHSIYGIHYIQPDIAGSKWTEIETGIEKQETTNNPDEISDIAVIQSNESVKPEIYVSQTFRRRIYKLDWEKKSFSNIWKDNSVFGTVDSLFPEKDELYFIYEGTVASIDYKDLRMRQRPDIQRSIRMFPSNLKPNCIIINNSQRIQLSELWLLNEPGTMTNNIAANKEGLYVPVHHVVLNDGLANYRDVINKAGLNMIVLDMKDDEGRLRFTPKNSAISARGRSFRPLDIDPFLQDMKKQGIYTIARITAFKDRELFSRENSKYAVWDRSGKPWVGYDDARRKKTDITEEDRRNSRLQFFPANDPDYEIVRELNDERWVDPYSEEIWDYIANISVELHERGFDEIQFDYIRFPTDGQNLNEARYRWQDSGMDMESAILSFLRHVRSRVKAPISICIYGANGWYRTGARTGQEVELLAPWVDVICPMYYPSHFEQHFLAQNPPEMRPWRIYYIGTLRNDRIGRGQVIIRPWAQAFFLNVSYDRRYYNNDYVRRQIEGVREAGKGGFAYWNMGGRYDDIF
ncbi:MAG: putative glycoside hydrolase [Treponema sp.]|nr:putative glycoside hydrolase [Treponema sp.]